MIKKLVINLTIVVCTLFVLDYVIGKTLRYYYFKEKSGYHFLITYAMERENADVLVFGSSRANHHYIPGVFEDSLKMSFYNTGYDGMGIFYQTAVLKSILKRYTPKVIILDFDGGFEKDDDSYDRMSLLLPYYRTHKEIRKIVEMKSRFEKIKLISEIYPFNSQIFTIAKGCFIPHQKIIEGDKGYVALYGEWSNDIAFQPYTIYELDTNKMNCFREFLNIAKRSVPNVVVVYSPIYLKFDKTQGLEICKSICKSENIPYWDFSKEPIFCNNKHLFLHVVHLNNNGATIFSKIVSSKIKRELHIH